MCTVTFLPAKNGYLLASSRDEKNNRKPALPPKTYQHGRTPIVYPKDTQAHGTWIAMKYNGDAAVLLNGAFKKHIPKPAYERSRGVVLLNIFESCNPLQAFLQAKLQNIEPFTLVLFVENILTECRWCGHEKYIKHLSNKSAYIWSSVTLYDDEVIIKRQNWFNAWLAKHEYAVADDLSNFHHFGGDGDKQNDILMKRENIYQTVSITVLELLTGSKKMIYHDLENNRCITKPIDTCDYATL